MHLGNLEIEELSRCKVSIDGAMEHMGQDRLEYY